MSLEIQILEILKKYYNPRIDELPLGYPVENDFVPFWSVFEGRTKRLAAALFNPTSVQINNGIEWVYDRKDNLGAPLPYNLYDIVSKGGKLYQSLVNVNTSTPGVVGNDLWELVVKAYSGGFWKAGVYTDVQPWVFSNHTGTTLIYELIDPARPFVSVNIETETSAGKWRSLSGKIVIDEVDTTQSEIVFDMKFDAQRWFRGSDNINSPKLWVDINAEDAIKATFIFTLSGLHTQTMPENYRLTSLQFNKLTSEWVPEFIGTYKFTKDFDGLGLCYVTIEGPFGGGGNTMPTIFDNVIGNLANNMVGGLYTYFDAEGDPESNQPPRAENIQVVGNQFPGSLLTASYTFVSPSNYVEGASLKQWYLETPDGEESDALPGETGLTIIVPADVGKVLKFGVLPVQTAPAPANGRPVGVEAFSGGVMIIAENVVTPELDLNLEYHQLLKHNTYDVANLRAPIMGTLGVGYFTSPVGREPTKHANGDLIFDPAVNIKRLTFLTLAGTSIKTHECVFVIRLDEVKTEYVLGISSNVWIRFQNTGDQLEVGFNGSVKFLTWAPAINTPYACRVRWSTNGTIVSMRLQVDYNEDTNMYLVDETINGANNGTTWAAQTGSIGSSVTDTSGLDGRLGELAIMYDAHLLDPDKILQLWKRLNNIKALMI